MIENKAIVQSTIVQKVPKKLNGLIAFGIVLSALAFIVFGIAIILFSRTSILDSSLPIDPSLFDQFGTFVGGTVGSMWSLAGVIFFIVALKYQSEQLDAQRQEMNDNRIILNKQADILSKQQFENTFFSMLSLYHEVVNNINIDGKSGKLAFTALRNDFDSHNRDLELLTGSNFESNHDIVNQQYSNYVFTTFKSQLAHYFRITYRIFRMVDKGALKDPMEKFFYAKILRSQLSDDELLFHFYNANSIYGKKFQKLIQDFNTLKQLPFLALVEIRTLLDSEFPDINKNIEMFIDLFSNEHIQFFSSDRGEKIQNTILENQLEIEQIGHSIISTLYLFNSNISPFERYGGKEKLRKVIEAILTFLLKSRHFYLANTKCKIDYEESHVANTDDNLFAIIKITLENPNSRPIEFWKDVDDLTIANSTSKG